MSELKLLRVQARSPFDAYYIGEALTVSGANKVGKFDILPGHADFFSVINPESDIVIGTDSEDIKINVANGIVCARDDEVLLFLNI